MARKYKPKIRQTLREIPLKKIKVWKEAQARKLDRSRVGNIAKSIRAEGLQNPPLLQKQGREYLLISGNHRFAALKSLGAKKAKFLVLTRDTAYGLDDAKAASVVENLHRIDMNTKDLAGACISLADQVGKVKAARKLGMAPQTFKKYHGFAGVPEKLKELVPKTISRDEATKLYQIMPSVPKALKVAQNMTKIDKRYKKMYLRVLAANPKSGHKTILKKMRKLMIRKKITVDLASSNARKLSRLAEKKDMDETKLAKKILTDYLKKRS